MRARPELAPADSVRARVPRGPTPAIDPRGCPGATRHGGPSAPSIPVPPAGGRVLRRTDDIIRPLPVATGPGEPHNQATADAYAFFLEEQTMTWEIPTATEWRFGFEITMYVANR